MQPPTYVADVPRSGWLAVDLLRLEQWQGPASRAEDPLGVRTDYDRGPAHYLVMLDLAKQSWLDHRWVALGLQPGRVGTHIRKILHRGWHEGIYLGPKLAEFLGSRLEEVARRIEKDENVAVRLSSNSLLEESMPWSLAGAYWGIAPRPQIQSAHAQEVIHKAIDRLPTRAFDITAFLDRCADDGYHGYGPHLCRFPETWVEGMQRPTPVDGPSRFGAFYECEELPEPTWEVGLTELTGREVARQFGVRSKTGRARWATPPFATGYSLSIPELGAVMDEQSSSSYNPIPAPASIYTITGFRQTAIYSPFVPYVVVRGYLDAAGARLRAGCVAVWIEPEGRYHRLGLEPMTMANTVLGALAEIEATPDRACPIEWS